VDLVLTKNIAWRFAQFDYLMTTHSGPAVGASGRQNNFRAATGLVLRFGIPNPPPPPNHSPVAAAPWTQRRSMRVRRHCDSTRKRQRPGQRFADL